MNKYCAKCKYVTIKTVPMKGVPSVTPEWWCQFSDWIFLVEVDDITDYILKSKYHFDFGTLVENCPHYSKLIKIAKLKQI